MLASFFIAGVIRVQRISIRRQGSLKDKVMIQVRMKAIKINEEL